METSAGKKLDDFMWPDKGKTNYNFITQRSMQTYKFYKLDDSYMLFPFSNFFEWKRFILC